VDCHHRVEQKREVNSLCFASQLERCSIPIEGERAFKRGDVNTRLVPSAQQPFFDRAVRRPVDELSRSFRQWNYGDYGNGLVGFYACKTLTRLNFFKFHETERLSIS